jgi:hypothetical protein
MATARSPRCSVGGEAYVRAARAGLVRARLIAFQVLSYPVLSLRRAAVDGACLFTV